MKKKNHFHCDFDLDLEFEREGGIIHIHKELIKFCVQTIEVYTSHQHGLQ